MVNFYDVLLVHQTATLEEIKLAFKWQQGGLSFGVPSIGNFNESRSSLFS